MSKIKSLKVISLIALFLITFSSHAQQRKDDFLEQLFQKQGGVELFGDVDKIRIHEKKRIIDAISHLSPVAKQSILDRANIELAKPWPVLTMSDFNAFKIDGNRSVYEGKFFAKRSKLTHMIIGELVEGKGRFLPEVINGTVLVLEESTWALPAHMYLQKAGEGLPDVEEPVIDLFAGQTATVLSWTKFMLGEQLNAYSPLLIKRIDRELENRVFKPYIKRDDFWWMGFNDKRMNNWNIYVNTNILISALIAQDDMEVRNKIVQKTVRSVDRYLNSQPLDGGCDEGPSYWGIAGGALVDYLNQLSLFSDQRLDFSKSNLIHNIGSYIYKVHIDKNYYVNFADAQLQATQDVGRIYSYGKLFKDQKLLGFASYLNVRNKAAEHYEMNHLHAFFSALGLQENLKGLKPKAPYVSSAWFPDIQVLTARQVEGSAQGIFVGAKAGTNFEAHNHNDVGSFVVYKNGNPILVDPGVGTYTKQTFGPDRYQLWYMQSAWHNCPTINGIMQQAGRGYSSSKVSFAEKQDQLTLSMDLAGAYPKQAEVASWNRKFVFNKADGSLELEEEYVLKSFKKASILSFIVNGSVTVVAPGKLLLKNHFGDAVHLTYQKDEFIFTKEIKQMDDPKMAYHLSKGITRVQLTKIGEALSGSHVIKIN